MLCLNRLWMASSSSVERFFSYDYMLLFFHRAGKRDTTEYDIYEMIQYDLICICWSFEHRSRMGRCKSSSTQVGNVKTLILSVLQKAEFRQTKPSLRPFSRTQHQTFPTWARTAHLLSFYSLSERGKKEIVEEKLKQLLFFNFVNGYRSFSHSWKLRMCYFIYGNFQTQAE